MFSGSHQPIFLPGNRAVDGTTFFLRESRPLLRVSLSGLRYQRPLARVVITKRGVRVKVSKSTRSILDEYRQALVAILGDELDSVVLYGSQARGYPDEGSDVDVLCIMKKQVDYGELIKRTSEVTARSASSTTSSFRVRLSVERITIRVGHRS